VAELEVLLVQYPALSCLYYLGYFEFQLALEKQFLFVIFILADIIWTWD